MWKVSGREHIQGFGGEKLKERGFLESLSVGKTERKGILGRLKLWKS
jgi:hypothetical protein